MDLNSSRRDASRRSTLRGRPRCATDAVISEALTWEQAPSHLPASDDRAPITKTPRSPSPALPLGVCPAALANKQGIYSPSPDPRITEQATMQYRECGANLRTESDCGESRTIERQCRFISDVRAGMERRTRSGKHVRLETPLATIRSRVVWKGRCDCRRRSRR